MAVGERVLAFFIFGGTTQNFMAENGSAKRFSNFRHPSSSRDRRDALQILVIGPCRSGLRSNRKGWKERRCCLIPRYIAGGGSLS